MRESGQTIVEWLAVLAGVVTLAGGRGGRHAERRAGGQRRDAHRDLRRHRRLVRRRRRRRSRARATAPPRRPRAGPPAATAAPPDQDLCGSSYFNVPELWFTPACANHDRCYGAHQGKAACDTAFLHDMLAICAKLPSSGGVNASFTRASCRAAAHLYYKGVVVGGGFSYCHRPVCREGE